MVLDERKKPEPEPEHYQILGEWFDDDKDDPIDQATMIEMIGWDDLPIGRYLNNFFSEVEDLEEALLSTIRRLRKEGKPAVAHALDRIGFEIRLRQPTIIKMDKHPHDVSHFWSDGVNPSIWRSMTISHINELAERLSILSEAELAGNEKPTHVWLDDWNTLTDAEIVMLSCAASMIAPPSNMAAIASSIAWTNIGHDNASMQDALSDAYDSVGDHQTHMLYKTTNSAPRKSHSKDLVWPFPGDAAYHEGARKDLKDIVWDAD
jgi:hypothetical protein